MRSVAFGVFCLLGAVVSVNAQHPFWFKHTPSLDFANYTRGYAMAVHPNGSVYVTGVAVGTVDFDGTLFSATEEPPHSSAFIARYSHDGSLIWVKKFITRIHLTDTDAHMFSDMAVDGNGDIVVLGNSQVQADFLGTSITSGPFVAKLDQEGNLKWVRSESMPMNDFGLRSTHLAIDRSNNILWYSLHSDFNSSSLRVTKYSPDSTKLWKKDVVTADPRGFHLMGSFGLDSADNIIISGVFVQTLFIGNKTHVNHAAPEAGDRSQIFVASFSPSGDYKWSMQSDFGTGYNAPRSHTTDRLGNIYLATMMGAGTEIGLDGTKYKNEGPRRTVLIKLNTSGQILWGKPLNNFVCNEIIMSKHDSTLYLTGAWSSDLYPESSYDARSQILKLSKSGARIGSITSQTFGYPAMDQAFQSATDENNDIYTWGNYGRKLKFGCSAEQTNQSWSFYLVKHQFGGLAINGPAEICAGSEITITTEKLADGSIYNWTLPTGVTPVSGTTSTTTNFIVVKVLASANGAVAKVASGVSCVDHVGGEYEFVVIAPPAPINISTLPTAVCVPSSTPVNVTPVPSGGRYVWTLPTGASTAMNYNGDSGELHFADAFEGGVFKVALTNLCGHQEKEVVIDDIPKPGAITELLGPQEICINLSKKVTFEAVGAPDAKEFVWNVPYFLSPSGVRRTTSRTLELNVTAAGKGSISVYGENSCAQTSVAESLAVTVSNEPLTPQISIDDCKSKITVIGQGDFEWYRNGIYLPDASGNFFEASDTGTYYVRIENTCGAKQSAGVGAYPVNSGSVVVPNVITPNGDGKNDRFIMAQPFFGSEINIFTRWGKSVYSSIYYKDEWTAEDVSPGVYYVLIKHHCLPIEGVYRGYLEIIK